MARLPIPGSDDGTWGDILNSFLVVAHNTDGTLKGNSLTSPGDITISSDSDASGAGDIVLKTGTTERLRFNTDGSMLWKNQVLVTRTFQSNPRADIPAGTNVFEIDEYGNVLFGPNDFLFTRQGNIFQMGSIADFIYHQETRRIYTRSAAFVEFGDPPDVIIARAGPDNSYPGVAGGPAGIPGGTNLGVIRWQGSFTPQGGTPDVTLGGAFYKDSAQIYAKAAEDNKFNGGTSYSQGGELYFATTRSGTSQSVAGLALLNDQTLQILGPRVVYSGGDFEFSGTQPQLRFDAVTDSSRAIVLFKLAGEAQSLFVMRMSGALEWGPGGNTPSDTFLERGAAGQMKVTGDLNVTGNIGGSQYRRISGLPSTSNNTNAVVSAADVYGMQTNGNLNTQSASGNVPAIFYLNPTDFAITGKTTKMRLRIGTLVNDTAPANTMTWGLYPVGNQTGGSGILNPTLGTVVSGSTVAQTTPAANAKITPVSSSDFTMPSAGFYMIGAASSGAMAANSKVATTISLEVRNV